MLSLFCILSCLNLILKYSKSCFKVLFTVKLKFIKNKIFMRQIFLKIKTINEKMFKNINMMCNCKNQNANKNIKL